MIVSKWRAVYIERCTYGSEGSVWKPNEETLKGAGRLPYHSTGHEKRLYRSGIIEVAAFGSEVYSKEELVAKIGAAMLCGVAGVDNSTLENRAAYIGGWLRNLKDDKKLIVQTAGQAQKAADFILGMTFEEAAE
ncbi:zincin-like metallopeptidase domain-containing protein [Paenibacillus sp. Soil522]|uniref:zincin-like metallopeptidase domain-containing protein n=1 Tax=Paenibacillus sp. Soil522 TaxID=1736388 RepID=UPI000B01C14A|nr:zincin-like metallopeptidase domain-containing protein [Paenibacillus sp. Soil522]